MWAAKPEPLFVIGTSVDTNTVYVGQGDHHPGLFRKVIPLETPHWVDPTQALEAGTAKAFGLRIRYRQALQTGQLIHADDGQHYMKFDEPQRGVAAGQFAAWHGGLGLEEVVGSAVIAR